MPRLGFAEAWRIQARQLLCEGVVPDNVHWSVEGAETDLFGALQSSAKSVRPVERPSVPASFVPLAEAALCHVSPERFALPYRLLWRLQNDREILGDRSDKDVAAVHAMEKSVRRDAHKMKAFVRFREVGISDAGRRQFIAWFEPEHVILERTAPFFARRFADMDWLIVTPGYAARFERGVLDMQLCNERPDLPDDSADDLWRTYYASIFNPARLKVKAMKSEMPVKYWKNLPEARLIPDLIANAEKSVQAMREAMPTTPHIRTDRIVARLPSPSEIAPDVVPETLDEARQAAAGCSRCDLCRYATQTVFGEGAIGSSVMFVGEQPGDIEDLSGRPFTGPAGQLFNKVLHEVGVDRSRAYVTNAVKHFKFEPRGKRRIHQRPDAGEVVRCRWWLGLERKFVQPKLIVALGATAALAVTGNGANILKRHGTMELADDGQTPVLLTIHPSAVLRSGNAAQQDEARKLLVEDLRRVSAYMPD
ncbi:UdgX family uracil-DNA binding protein [Rhizobium sp. P38BS-XIX]|uniref:UdgX family uracil-DNA binding protein n=1 Tax=Rhizobium sp. P38BS-XIX TaxID=2726740 RepID=UPI001FF0766F|nr:UdgX family uracil-DNA binding protein [Rhizobium sp. P38BS-XIX]